MSRKWLLTVIAMTMFLGLFYRVLKHNAAAIDANDTSITVLGFELNPFSRTAEEIRNGTSSPRAFKSKVSKFLAQNKINQTPGQFSFTGQPTDKSDLTKKKKEDEAKKRQAARKRLQELRKKSWQEYLRAMAERNKATPDSTRTNGFTGDASAPITGIFIPNQNDDKDKNDEVYETWAALLLNEPHFGHTTDFIREYQAGRIPEEIFYKLVGEMLNDPRTAISEQGLTAASSTPSLRSFNTVAEFMERATPDNTVRVRADGELRSVYSSIGHLGTLSRVLSQSTSAFALTLSTQILTRMVQQYLAIPDPGTGSDPGTVQTAAYQANLEKFKQVLPTLERLTQESQDRQVVDAAQSLAQEIQRFI